MEAADGIERRPAFRRTSVGDELEADDVLVARVDAGTRTETRGW
jgi:hypothetical protein